jgi:hypothetical protein
MRFLRLSRACLVKLGSLHRSTFLSSSETSTYNDPPLLHRLRATTAARAAPPSAWPGPRRRRESGSCRAGCCPTSTPAASCRTEVRAWLLPYDDRTCILSTVYTCVLIAHCSCFCCGGVCLWLRLCVPRVLCLQALARLWRWARARKCTWATPPAPLTSATRPRRPPTHHRTAVRDMILLSTPIHRFQINMMVLPRQARDKTRGANAEGKGVSFRRSVAHLCQKRLWGLGVFVLALGGRACLCKGAEHACLGCLHLHTVTLPRQARDTT